MVYVVKWFYVAKWIYMAKSGEVAKVAKSGESGEKLGKVATAPYKKYLVSHRRPTLI